MAAKRFSIEDADRALSLVSPIVSDVLAKMKKAKELHDSVQIEKQNENSGQAELLFLLGAIKKCLQEIEHHIKELDDIGCHLKDPAMGLVDFPSEHEGRKIFLCWMAGEDGVKYWHEVNQGFQERKAIQMAGAALS